MPDRSVVVVGVREASDVRSHVTAVPHGRDVVLTGSTCRWSPSIAAEIGRTLSH